jgi:hypothetical protein
VLLTAGILIDKKSRSIFTAIERRSKLTETMSHFPLFASMMTP